MSTYDFTTAWGFVNLHLSFVLFFKMHPSLSLHPGVSLADDT